MSKLNPLVLAVFLHFVPFPSFSPFYNYSLVLSLHLGKLYNPDFNPIEFEGVRMQAGLHAFSPSRLQFAAKYYRILHGNQNNTQVFANFA